MVKNLTHFPIDRHLPTNRQHHATFVVPPTAKTTTVRSLGKSEYVPISFCQAV